MWIKIKELKWTVYFFYQLWFSCELVWRSSPSRLWSHSVWEVAQSVLLIFCFRRFVFIWNTFIHIYMYIKRSFTSAMYGDAVEMLWRFQVDRFGFFFWSFSRYSINRRISVLLLPPVSVKWRCSPFSSSSVWFRTFTCKVSRVFVFFLKI